jgi:hypothetical protein
MADIFQRRTLSGWIPADAESEAAWRKQKPGEVYRGTFAKPRNYKHHCLFMVLLNEVTFPNQERFTDRRMFRRAVALEAGFVDVIVTLDGEEYRIPRSYSYEELPEEEDFTKEFGKAMAICAAILRMTCPDLEEEVSRYASETHQVDCPRIFREHAKERAA